MAATIIFLIGIFSIYIYAINFTGETEETLNKMYYEGGLASSLILSEGYPENWNLENVKTPGILNQERINQSKLEMFYNLSNEDYRSARNKLDISYNFEFYFNFSNMKIEGEEISGIGKKPTNTENIILTKRFSIYENKPIKINLYIWN